LSRDPAGEATDLTANLYEYVGGNPISFSDPTGLLTIQLGLSGGYTFPWGGSGVAFVGVAVDLSGGIGVYYGAGGGGGVGVGFSGGVNAGFSNGNTICDLAGPFANVSRGGGWGDDVTGDAFYGKNQQGGDLWGGSVTEGAGLGVTSFVGGTETKVVRLH
jgi:hypothetical protein